MKNKCPHCFCEFDTKKQLMNHLDCYERLIFKINEKIEDLDKGITTVHHKLAREVLKSLLRESD